MIRPMCAIGLLLLLLSGVARFPAQAQDIPPGGASTDSVAPPAQGPVPNNPDALQPPPSDAGPVVPSEEMSSFACVVWAILIVGVVALLVWIFGSLRRSGTRGAPYADVTHNPSASGPYFPGTQPGMTGFSGFLGGLPGVYLASRILRRKRRDKEK